MSRIGYVREQPAIGDQLSAVSAVISPRDLGKPSWKSWEPALAYRGNMTRLALIYRCVNLISHGAGVAPVRVYDEAKDNETLPDHPLRNLMRRPNPQMGEATFHGTVAMRSAMSGFCIVEKERNRLGQVIALWPLQSSWAKAIPRSNSAPDWAYTIPGIANPFVLKAEDVIVYRWADSPTGSPYGIGPLEACLREVDILNSMMDFLKAFFDSGAVPLYGIIPDTFVGQTLSQKKVDAILEQFIARHAGLDNAALPMVLQGIKDVKRLGFDMDELAYVDLHDLSDLSIIQSFGIPASVAQVRVGLEHSDSRANVEGDEGKFYRQAIIPFWSRWDDCLTLNLLPDFDETPTISLEFDTSRVTYLQEDRNAKAAWTGAAVSAGYMTVHAWHREMGLPEPKGEDFYLRSIATVALPIDDPLGLDAMASLPAPAPIKDAPVQGEPAALSASHNCHSFYDDPASLFPLNATDLFERTRGLPIRERLAKRAVGGDRKQMARLAKVAAPKINAFLDAQGKRIIPKVIEGLKSTGPTDQLTLKAVNWNSENSRLKGVMDPIYNAIGETALKSAEAVHGVPVGISWDLANPRVKDVMKELGTHVVDINETTRADIQRIVTKGVDEGIGQDAIAERLQELFGDGAEARARTIARTEVTNAYGKANIVAFKESDVVDRVQLFDNPEHDTDPGDDGLTCAERDLLVVDLDEADTHLEAEHPNGSLTLTPVLKGEVIPDKKADDAKADGD